MLDKIKPFATGTLSIALIEEIPKLTEVTGADVSQIVQTLIQIIIGIATLLKLFRKPIQ